MISSKRFQIQTPHLLSSEVAGVLQQKFRKGHMKFSPKILSWFLVLAVIGCTSYRHPDIIIRSPSYYEAQAKQGDLALAADPYVTKGKHEMLFNESFLKKGIYPVHLIFFNEGDDIYTLKDLEIFLEDEAGNRFKPLTPKEAKPLVSRSVLLRGAAFGMVGNLTIFFGVPIAIWGGLDTYKANYLAKDMISGKAFETGRILPREISQGFIFFAPAKGQKGRKVLKRLELPYRIYVLGVKNSKGESVNYSLYLQPRNLTA
jgi:hypothetical protein